MQGWFSLSYFSLLPQETLRASDPHRVLDDALGFVSAAVRVGDLHRESDADSPQAPLSSGPLRAPATHPVLAASAGKPAPPTGTFLTHVPRARPNVPGATRWRADGAPLHFSV